MRKLSMRAVLLLASWLLCAVPAFAADDESKQRAVDALFADVTADGSGVAVGIYHEGKVIYARGFGNAVPGRVTPVTPQTVFHVASVSKQFTAFAIAMLARDGKVKLDQDIRTYLPEMPDFGTPITVDELVHHTGGLKEQNMMFWMAQRYRNDNLKQEQALTLIGRQRELVSAPGTRFSYNNSGYTLLAGIVQAASGQSLRQFTDARVFGPLGMKQTLFRDDATEIIPEFAEGYTARGKGWGRSVLATELVGPTGLYTSIDDMMKWLGNFDRPKVGDAALIQQISAPGRLRNGKPLNYGFGLYNQSYGGHAAIAHDGADTVYRSTLVFVPKERFGVVVLANSQRGVNDLARKIVEIHLGVLPGPRSVVDGGAPVIESTAKQRQALVGHYLNPYLWAADIVEKDGKLQWASMGWANSDVQLRKGDVFSRSLGTELRYFKIERDARGTVTGFRLAGGIGEDAGDRYERIPDYSPTAADLERLTGAYRTDEVDITYTFAVRDGELTARSIWSTKPIRLKAVTPNRYDTDDIPMGSIEFVRDASGKPTGFNIVGGGMRGTKFERIADDFDVVIRGGTVYDGTGAPGRKVDVGLRGDRIAALGDLRGKTSKRTVNATGLAVAPGFINMLSWATDSLLIDGNSQSDIRQGVTLELLGEGMTMGPLNDAMKQQFAPRMRKIGVDVAWTTLAQYLELLEKRGVSPNVASFVGATTVRLHVIGAANRQATPAELQTMQQLVRDAMKEGAFGVSSALAYAPATFANTEELIALSKAAAEFGGIYISHIRDEGDRLVESVDEVIDIALAANIPAEIYHLKALGVPNWQKLGVVIDKVEAARKAGVRITADMYPYTASATGFDVTMPPWVQEGGLEAWIARLKDPTVRARLVAEMKGPSTPTWSNRLLNAGSPENVLILGAKSPQLQPIVGKTLGAIARERGTSIEDTVIDLVIEDGSRLQVAYFLMSEDNLRRAIALPWMSFGSDAGSPTVETAASQGPEHPRAYGTFARVLGKYVRDDKVISLEEAVRRLSALPAETLGISDRGRLEAGRYADVVIFDPAAIADRSSFDDPHRYAVGMRDVFVNGVQVLADGEHTGARPGKFVRHRGRAAVSLN